MQRTIHFVPSLLSTLVLLFSVAWLRAAPDDRFHGGAYDGGAASVYTGYAPPVGGDESRYVGGGGYDGYATAALSGYTIPAGGQLGRFVGGGYDGHGISLAASQPNPLIADSDGDGVPDWWESKFYLGLTFADANTDTDGDGGGAFFEYMADTDPTDFNSRLAVLTLDKAEPIRVSFRDTSTAREYWIEVSTTLLTDSWSAATSPPATGVGGDMQLEFPDDWPEDSFFRVRVKLPD